MTNPADKLSLLMATPNEEPVSQYKGVVQQTDDSKACVLIDGGTAVWCDTMDVKALVGDRVRVEVRKHKGTLVANYTHPVTDDAVANEALDKVETLEVDALKADSAVIKNLQADTAKVHNLTADQLSAATAYVGELTAGEVTAQSIIADKAKLAQVDTDQLNADHAVIETLDSTYASIDNLNAATARIGNIEADYLVAADMTAEQARVGQLMAGKADVADLTAANARIDNLQSTKADISVLESDYITADAIDATYLHADMSNADVAWIQNGVIKNGSISNAMINDVSANKLTAGTINGSVINVTNLNADNITAGTINGQRIGEGSLSLDKLSEDVYTEAEVDTIVEGLNDRIDGAIETHTGTTVPTLNNAPASAWNTTALRDEHVGDVYYVVNSQSQQNGYCYRFTKSGSTYSWQLIKDSDVTAALSRLNTAEGKITTFDSDISTLKTDTGTLKTKTESLETRMSDAEDDILDKVDTTTFNEVSDTVDQHSQTITQMSQTLSNKADGSTVTALTTRVSKNEQDITGINTTVGELSTTVESKADGSTVESVSNRLNTVSNTVDGHTQSISSINSTLATKADSSTVSTLTTKVNTISDTVDGHTSQLSSITTTQTSIQGSAVKSTVQLWFTKANTTAPNKPTAHVTTNNASTANAWNLAVPTYNASYPYYYYCYEHQLLNDTYTWSAVTRDIATEESQSTSRSAASAAAAADTKAGNAATAAATADGKAVSAQNTANKNVRESQQLWFTKANSTAPAKPTSKVTSTATTGNAWTTRVPTYSDSYKYYFYCMQYIAADGTVTWSDVIYDQATTEAQSVARAASADLTEFHQEYATFKQTTQQFESTVGETYATKNELKTTDDKIENLEIGGRNLLLGTNQGKTYWLEPSGNGTYAANTTIDNVGVRYEILTQATNWCVFAYKGLDNNSLAKSALSAADKYFTVSFDIRPSVDLTTTMLATGSGFQFVDTNAGNRQIVFGNPNFTLQKDVWNHVELTGKALGVSAANQCFYWNYKAPVGTYDFKNLKIERGTKATDWTPAPEDIEASVSSIEERVSTAETSITNNSREIGLRAIASDVYTKAQSDGLIATEVINRDAAITAKANEITSTVSQTYTTKQEFADLEIGGRNLARNTADFSGWGRDNTVWTFSDGVATFIPPSTRSWKQFGQIPGMPLSLFDFDATYVISFDAMLVNGTVASGDSLSPCVALRNTADTISRKRYRSWNIISSLTSEWQRITKVIDPLPISSWDGTASSEAYFGVDFWLYTATATIAIRNIKLEKGNKATDWTPAPEDLDSHFESVESSIAQTAEGITESVSKNYATKDESQLDRAGSGTSVTVEGAANAALKGLHVLGKSVQDGTPTPSSPVQILSVGPNPVGKTDVWLQGGIDGNTGATDSRTSRIHTELVAVVGGKAYTLAFDEESQYGLEVYQYKADGTYITTSHGWRESPYTIVMNGSTSFVRLLAYDKTSNSITKSAIETFNPRLYHGTYPVPFVEDIGFWVRGRNLLPSDAEFWRQTGIDGSTGNYTENNQQRAASWAVRVMPSTDYTISATSGTRFAVYQYTDEGAYIPVTYGWWTNSRTFTTQAEAAGLRVLISNADDSDVDLNTIADRSLQVEIGTSATPYQPYTESVTPIPLNGHELRSLPDGTQDELTVDVDGHVTMTQRVGSVTLDGSETWTMIAKGSGYSGYSGSYLGYAAAPTEAASPVSGGLVAFCNKYSVPNPARIALYTDNSAAINNSSMSGSKRVFVFDSTLTSSAADFKAVLASSPMELTYPLATPQTIDLGTIDMPRVHDGDTVEVIAALTPSIDATWWASAGQAVADAYASLSSAIEVRAESIVSTVSERYATSQQVQAISSQIEQTAQGWTAQFNELTGGADLSMTLAQAFDALGVTSRNLEEIRSFVRITTDSNGDPLLLMGSATSPIMLALSNDSLRFMHGPDPVAYIDVDGTTNEGRLHITRAVVVKELQFGSWKWFERDGVGNLALKWVGDE